LANLPAAVDDVLFSVFFMSLNETWGLEPNLTTCCYHKVIKATYC